MFSRRGYLLEITHRVPTMRTFRRLVDILAACGYNELILHRAACEPMFEDEPPRFAESAKLALYCEMQGLELLELDGERCRELLSDRTVSVATEAGRSLAGRVETMRERMEAAEEQGRIGNLRRFLVTDFSDGSCWQPLVVSLPGIVMGGHFACSGHKAAKMDLELELNRILEAPVGGLLLRLGTLYLRGGALRSDASEFFNILLHDHGYSRHPGLTDLILDEVGGVAHGVKIAAERWVERSDWAVEIAYAADLIDCACHRRSEPRLKALREAHGRVWRLRFEEAGRVDSLSRLPRF